MGKEEKAEGACMRATLKFLGKQVQIFSSLAHRPNNHDEVADFVNGLLELERISGWSLADIGTDQHKLELIVLNAFNNTVNGVNYGSESIAQAAQIPPENVSSLKKKAKKALEIFYRHNNSVPA